MGALPSPHLCSSPSFSCSCFPASLPCWFFLKGTPSTNYRDLISGSPSREPDSTASLPLSTVIFVLGKALHFPWRTPLFGPSLGIRWTGRSKEALWLAPGEATDLNYIPTGLASWKPQRNTEMSQIFITMTSFRETVFTHPRESHCCWFKMSHSGT